MANIVLASQSNLATATITSGAFASTAPPANLKRPEPGDKLILTSDADAYVVIDLGTATAVRMLQALYVETTTSRPTTWRWRGATSEASLTSAPGYDSGTVAFASGNTGLPHRNSTLHDFIWFDSAKTYRWWRLDFDVQCAIGNIVVHPGWQPSRNIAYGFEPPMLADHSSRRRGRSGRNSVWPAAAYDAASFTFDAFSADDALRNARDFDEAVGTRSPVSVVFDPDATIYRQELMMFGYLNQSPPIQNASFALYQRRYEIEEIVP